MDSGKDCGEDRGRLEKLLQLLEREGGDQAMVDSLVRRLPSVLSDTECLSPIRYPPCGSGSSDDCG